MQPGEDQPRLRVQCLCQRFPLVESLRQGERPLEVDGGALGVSREIQETSELGSDRGDVRFRARLLERCERRLETRGCLRGMAVVEVDVRQPRGHSRRAYRVGELLVGGVSPLEQYARLSRPVGLPGHLSRASSQIGARRLVVDQFGGLLEVPLRLGRRREALRALAGPHKRRRRTSLQLLGVVGVGNSLVGRQQVGCDHLRDLVLGERSGKLVRSSEVTALPVAPRERLVGDPAHEVLQEAVLAVLGRARIGLQREHLLAHERGQERLELTFVLL